MRYCKVCRGVLTDYKQKFCSSRCLDINKSIKRRGEPIKCIICHKWMLRRGRKWCSRTCMRLDARFVRAVNTMNRLNSEIKERIYKTEKLTKAEKI